MHIYSMMGVGINYITLLIWTFVTFVIIRIQNVSLYDSD